MGFGLSERLSLYDLNDLETLNNLNRSDVSKLFKSFKLSSLEDEQFSQRGADDTCKCWWVKEKKAGVQEMYE